MARPVVVSRRPGPDGLLYLGLAILAFVVRLTPVLIGGGLGSFGRYDDGVYYAAADALTFGRVPYRDFVMLHPPGIMVVLAPFAFLGRLTSDPVGMAAGRLTFMGIGALNAVLVAALARRWGRPAALAAGLLYACWLPAVYGEQSTLLEPLGGTALLTALLLLVKTNRPPPSRAQVIAGVALGLAVSMKIWYVAPWGVVVAWLLMLRQTASAVRVAVAGTVALLIVVLPFAILARGRMLDMVIRDQLLRPQAATGRLGRLSSILGLKSFLVGHHGELGVATGAAFAAMVVVAVVCWFDREARVLVALLAVNLLVLFVSPAYFPHYAALTAAPGALVLGVALGRLAGHRQRRRLVARAVFAIAIVVILASGIRIVTTAQGTAFPGTELANAAPSGCVTSDLPEALIQMNRLSRDLSAGCRVAVDVTGITYDTLHRVNPSGTATPRGRNRAFQRYLYDYLVSGESFVIARKAGDAIPPDILHALQRRTALTRVDGLVLRQGTGER